MISKFIDDVSMGNKTVEEVAAVLLEGDVIDFFSRKRISSSPKKREDPKGWLLSKWWSLFTELKREVSKLKSSVGRTGDTTPVWMALMTFAAELGGELHDLSQSLKKKDLDFFDRKAERQLSSWLQEFGNLDVGLGGETGQAPAGNILLVFSGLEDKYRRRKSETAIGDSLLRVAAEFLYSAVSLCMKSL